MEEQIVLNPGSLCRICLSEGTFDIGNHEVFVNNEYFDLQSMLETFSTIKKTTSSEFPSMLCPSCTDELAQCFGFWSKVQKADEQLLQLFGEAEVAETAMTAEECTSNDHPESDTETYIIEEDHYEKNDTVEILSIHTNSSNNSRQLETVKAEMKKVEGLSKIIDENLKVDACKFYSMPSTTEGEAAEAEQSKDKKRLEEEERTAAVVPPSPPAHANNAIIESFQSIPRRKYTMRNPKIPLTENVSNILSHVKKKSEDDRSKSDEDVAGVSVKDELEEPPVKRIKKDNDCTQNFKKDGYFSVLKFILTEPSVIIAISDQNVNYESDRVGSSVEMSSTVKNAIRFTRTFDVKIVDVKLNEKFNMVFGDETYVESSDTMYMCKYCSRAYSIAHHLIMHARKSHLCQFCLRGFEHVEDLYRHGKEDHTIFSCVLCKKSFTSNSNLRQHMKRVHCLSLPAHVSLLSYRPSEEDDPKAENNDVDKEISKNKTKI